MNIMIMKRYFLSGLEGENSDAGGMSIPYAIIKLSPLLTLGEIFTVMSFSCVRIKKLVHPRFSRQFLIANIISAETWSRKNAAINKRVALKRDPIMLVDM